jgi:hypothetical protein
MPEKLVIQNTVGQREPNDRAFWRKFLRLEDNFVYPFDSGHLPLCLCRRRFFAKGIGRSNTRIT